MALNSVIPKSSSPVASMFVFRAGSRPAAVARPFVHHTVRQLNSSTALKEATSSSSSRRRSVTVVNDTGAVPWKQLSLGEKAARTTQQTFNVGLVLVGLGLTGAVATVLWLEVFSTDSKTAIFNKSADLVRKDSKCLELLAGEGFHNKREISAFGEPSWSRWARNRTIASRLEKDRAGTEHLHMHFYVEGPTAKGTVQVHMTRRPGEKDFEYRMLALDVPGRSRHYLVDAEAKDQLKHGKMFGIRWN
ncbi:mitochondrial import inner membrane translocase subunit tim21 [Acrodontium crateriforme]|uniref:Mitochondrial import inner membrane translocase subunit Tim21 n=1 Tax=Acrodontium crateriforme TaxID=150365 RepID=A0AAQ3M0Q7_9PEZI|nr:mitochondrial import inner membrane translocase subunit tim21 [Acrodontium crateriforme]